MDGSENEPVLTLAVDPKGASIVSGGGDTIVRQWNYDEGFCQKQGHGHSGAVHKLAISPDSSTIVSVGSEGGIFIWDFEKA